MTKFFLLLSVSCIVLLTGCRKSNFDEGPDSNAEKFKVSFSAGTSGKEMDFKGVQQLSVPVTGLINQLTFMVYDAQSKAEVYRSTQFANTPQFGQINFELPLGEYEFVAVGSKTEFGINKFFRNNDVPLVLPFGEANMQYWQPSFTMSDKHYKTDDTFFMKQHVVISSNQSISLVMQRIIGRIEVIVEDSPNFTVGVENEATGYLFESETSFGNIDHHQYTVANVNGGSVVINILRTHSPLRLDIAYGDAIGQWETVSVPVYKNKRTVVRGKLKDHPANTSFSVTINDEWLSDAEEVNF
jgi:hypothetical protein